MKKRLELLDSLLTDTGVILVQIDKEQSAYLKVLMDEIFTRNAFITTIAVRMSATSGFKIEHADKTIVKNVEYIHVYSKNLRVAPAYEEAEYDPHYSLIIKPIEGGKYRLFNLLQEAEVVSEFEKYHIDVKAGNLSKLYKVSEAFQSYVFNNMDYIGRTHTAPSGAEKEKAYLNSVLLDNYEVIEREYTGGKYYIKKTNSGFNQFIPISLKFKMVDTIDGYSMKLSNILGDWWDGFYLDMGNVDNEGSVYFKNSKKPERLIMRILNMFTKPGEYVLDSFLGSGTTAAVAHKMNRKWIGIELGDHAYSLCKPRIDSIVEGKDESGITNMVKWNGGGGYHFYELAPSLLIKNDKLPIYQINPDYTFEMLCEAICKIEGFKYKPVDVFHGHSSERRFIHVTKYKDVIDPYYSLVGYFNSIRELGGAVRLLQDDIPKRIYRIKNKYDFESPRYLNRNVEITSRMASYKIPEKLNQLEMNYHSKECLDTAIATNMIAVGMDVDRLGLMVVTGQPKQNSEYIQATSRIGRAFPGLVVTLYNAYRPRDLSHYENFTGYHSQLYRFVEGTTATPFSARARDRVLHALIISAIRLYYPEMAKNADAALISSLNDEQIASVKQLIIERLNIIKPSAKKDAEDEIDQFIDWWKLQTSQPKQLRYYVLDTTKYNRLMNSYDQPHTENEKPTLRSMREVESTATMFYYTEE